MAIPPDEFDKCKVNREDPKPILLRSPTSIYEGYYHTGDQGYFSKDIMLYLVGREDK